MLGHFPQPHDDELLCNIIARLYERIGYLDYRGLGEDVFNSRAATAVSDLPHRLAGLGQKLSLNFGITPAVLIDEHTLWPFHAAFQTSDRRETSRAEMLWTGHPYLRLGLMAVRAPWPRFFRFCASCVIADRQSPDRETYWHRAHQIPGIEVCGIHRERLQDSFVPFRQPRNRFEYRSAEHPGALPENMSAPHLKAVTKVEVSLANGAAWILAHPTATRAGLELRDRYLWELASRGYATWSGQLRASQLKAGFLERYPSPWLDRVACGLGYANESWLERLFRKPLAPQFTVRHLLLIDFLGLTVEGILCSDNPLPFGSSPWPCLNAASTHYKKLTVERCDITVTRSGASLMGRFTCPVCGMTYIRLGPDSVPDNRMRRDWIPVYGAVFDNRLIELWSKPTVSLRELSRQLGVDTRTAQLQAHRLQLRSRNVVEDTQLIPPLPNEMRTPPNREEEYKSKWLKLLMLNPGGSRTDLRELDPKLFAYLRRHVRQWLEEHSPTPRIPANVQRKVDWMERDGSLSHDVCAALDRLSSRVPPVRLTRTAVLREAGIIWAVQKLAHLPIISSILNDCVEARAAFAVRRIQAVAANCERNGETLQKWKIVRRANIRPELLNDLSVSAAIQQALKSPKPAVGTKKTRAAAAGK